MRLLHPRAHGVGVVLGLHDGDGEVRAVVEHVVGALRLATAHQLSAHDHPPLRELHLLAHLRVQVPPGRDDGRSDELAADVPLGERLPVHGARGREHDGGSVRIPEPNSVTTVRRRWRGARSPAGSGVSRRGPTGKQVAARHHTVPAVAPASTAAPPVRPHPNLPSPSDSESAPGHLPRGAPPCRRPAARSGELPVQDRLLHLADGLGDLDVARAGLGAVEDGAAAPHPLAAR